MSRLSISKWDTFNFAPRESCVGSSMHFRSCLRFAKMMLTSPSEKDSQKLTAPNSFL